MKTVTLYTDGACSGNPGPGGWGASAGHGLNLQSGGHIAVWYSLTTSLELYQQACKRLHRQGQAKPVINYILLSRGTYDEVVYRSILQSKEKEQNAVLAALKARLREYDR